MLTERYFASVCGPPITNNTAVAKDVGIYEHVLQPSHSTAGTFKKSSTSRNGLAISDTHVFSAQHEKSTVHVYSRAKGNQEATVTFQERIRSVALLGEVLILGTDQGRIILWEVSTGRQITTPACHVQAVTCIASTPYHLITGSDDSNILVWQVARLLELDTTAEHEPEQTLSNHRAAITALAVSQSTNPDTNICVSASRDKSCIVWNYQTGVALRTLLLPSPPISLSLDPCTRAFYVSTEDCSMIAVELFAEKAFMGSQDAEASSTVVQASPPFGTSSQEAGPASCLGLSYDGTVLLSGHANGQILRWDLSTKAVATELANLNASVTNISFVPPLAPATATQTVSAVKPFLGSRSYNLVAQLSGDLTGESRFGDMVSTRGFAGDALEQTILSLQQPQVQAQAGTAGGGDDELRKENENLWAIINEQRALQKKTVQRFVEGKSGAS